MTRKIGIALAAATMLLAGCGGSDGGDGGDARPSVDDISSVLSEGAEVGGEDFAFPEDQAECVAKAYHDSDLSDDFLQALVDKDADFEPSEADLKAMASVSAEDLVTCLTK